MIDTKALKQKILDMAIRGQLVPQDPNDEPASTLLEKIRTEKQRLIKEGKIKKDKVDSIIFKGDDNRYYEKIGKEVKDITAEIDFELPSGWEFIRLSSIGVFTSGYTPKPSELANIGKVPYFKVADMNTIGNEKYLSVTEWFLLKNPSKLYPKYSIVFPKNGGAVFTNKKRILAQDSVVDLNTGVFTSVVIDFNYVYLIFLAIDFTSYYKGTALPTINTNKLNAILYGLPPIAEQKRIVACVDELFNKINTIEDNQAELEQLYEDLKKKTLDLAIRGKLVPQDPNDEPASELLKRIRVEKKSQLGKKYVESYIYKGDDNCYYEKVGSEVKNITDKIPFEIPENWRWARLSEISCYIHRGKSPKYGTDKILPIIAQKCNQWNGINTTKCLFAEKTTISNYSDEQYLKNDDIIINSTGTGTVGRIGIVKESLFALYPKFVADSHVTVVRTCNDLQSEYLFLVLCSPIIQTDIESKCSGSTNQIELATNTICNFLIPIPPYGEQIRIINVVKELNIIIEKGEY